jgi:hypothetical protein
MRFKHKRRDGIFSDILLLHIHVFFKSNLSLVLVGIGIFRCIEVCLLKKTYKPFFFCLVFLVWSSFRSGYICTFRSGSISGLF